MIVNCQENPLTPDRISIKLNTMNLVGLVPCKAEKRYLQHATMSNYHLQGRISFWCEVEQLVSLEPQQISHKFQHFENTPIT